MMMQKGAVAMLDALGFKGIWKRYKDPQIILDRMHLINERSRELVDDNGNHFAGVGLRRASRLWGGLTPHFAFLSDTLIVAYSKEECGRLSMQAALQKVGRVVANIIELGAAGEPPFVFRGAISAGAFVVDNTFVMGEAIDDAATHMNLAEAAVVWVTPKALKVLDGIPRGHLNASLVQHKVPLKNGATFSTLVTRYCNPYVAPASAFIRTRILNSFVPDEDLGLQIKKQNTEALLDVVEGASVNREFLLPALHLPGTNVLGGLTDLWCNGSDPLPILNENGTPYEGSEDPPLTTTDQTPSASTSQG